MYKIFKTGDSVIYKMANQQMTIDYLTKTGQYNCRWYEGMILKEATFNPNDLEFRTRNNKENS